MNNLKWSLICWSYSRAIQTEAQPRFVIHLVICSFSLDLDGLSHLLPPNLYLAKREGNSNKKRISRTSNYQNLTCQKTKLEFINMHTLKMNLPYWVLFLEVNQVARVQGEMTYSIKNISPAQIWSWFLRAELWQEPVQHLTDNFRQSIHSYPWPVIEASYKSAYINTEKIANPTTLWPLCRGTFYYENQCLRIFC